VLDVATQLAKRDKVAGRRLYEQLRQPFSVYVLDQKRLGAALEIASHVDFQQLCAEALHPLEPYVPWNREFLSNRARCYRETAHPLAAQAQADLDAFLSNEPVPFARGLPTAAPAATPSAG
jgi:spermidine synthase